MFIPKTITELTTIFRENGFDFFLVGGCVRDSEMGETPKDYDASTNATVEDMEKFLSGKFKCNLQGADFGVYVVYTEEMPDGIEIASFQTRQGGIIKTGMTIEDDIQRRDLTINALFYDDSESKIIDLVGGVEDLKNRLIKMVGIPNERIVEDPLRIVRALRFNSKYNGTIHIDTSKAIHKLKHLINEPTVERPNGISQERIKDEFMKSFKQSKDFNVYLDTLNEFDLWDNLFKGIKVTKKPIINSNQIEIVMAQLLKDNEDFTNNKSIGVHDWGFDSKMINRVNFLVRLLNLDNSNIISLEKDRGRFHITKDLLLEFNEIFNIDLINKFIDFDSSVISNSIKSEFEDEFGEICKSNGKQFGEFMNGKKLEFWLD